LHRLFAVLTPYLPEPHQQAPITQPSPASIRSGQLATRWPRPGSTHSPVRTSYIHPCQGQARRVPESLPSLSGPPWWAQTSLHAKTSSLTRARTMRVPPASTSVSWPAGSSSRRATRIRGMDAPRLRLPLPRSPTRLRLFLQDEGAVEPGHVLPTHQGGMTHGLDRLGLLLGGRGVTLDDRVAALAVHLVGLDVDREELDLVVGEAVVRLERRQVAPVDARHL